MKCVTDNLAILKEMYVWNICSKLYISSHFFVGMESVVCADFLFLNVLVCCCLLRENSIFMHNLYSETMDTTKVHTT